jgi:hypothetical protein
VWYWVVTPSIGRQIHCEAGWLGLTTGKDRHSAWHHGRADEVFDVLSVPQIAFHTLSGVIGNWKSVTPSGVSASRTTLSIAAGAPIEPASPQPLAPSALWGQG